MLGYKTFLVLVISSFCPFFFKHINKYKILPLGIKIVGNNRHGFSPHCALVLHGQLLFLK